MSEHNTPPDTGRRDFLKLIGVGTAAMVGYAGLLSHLYDAMRITRNDIMDRRTTLGTSTPPSEKDLEIIIEAYEQAYKTADNSLQQNERHELAVTKVKAVLKDPGLKIEKEISEDDLSIILSQYERKLLETINRLNTTIEMMPPPGL